jgi:hypothetical protein
VTEVQREARAFLEAMVTYLQNGSPLPQSDTVRASIERARNAAEAALREKQEFGTHGRTLRVLLFALEEVADNFSDLQRFAS